MAKVPPIDERNFLKLTQNHSEFRRKIQELGHETVALDVTEVAYRVGQCWLRLACEHMQDAKAAMASNLDRSAYSRSYYSVYNASKAIRWIRLSGASRSLTFLSKINRIIVLRSRPPTWSLDAEVLVNQRSLEVP